MFWAVINAIIYTRPVWRLELGTWGQKLFIAFIWSQHMFHICQDFFFLFTVICTLMVLLLLRHDHTASTALLSFVSKTNTKTKKWKRKLVLNWLDFLCLLLVLIQFKLQFSFIMNWCRSDVNTHKVRACVCHKQTITWLIFSMIRSML